MLAILNKDLEFLDNTGKYVLIPKDTTFFIDYLEKVGYFEVKDEDFHVEITKDEYCLCN